jgi:ribose 5-phosphate isomerase B
MAIIVAADHGGLVHKSAIKTWLETRGETVFDAGPREFDPVDDFPDFAHAAVRQWQEDPSHHKIIFWCRSGVGMIIAANRFQGLRTGFALNRSQLQAAVRDDHLNGLVFASDYQSLEQQKEMIEIFLHTPHDQSERFLRRLGKIDELNQ